MIILPSFIGITHKPLQVSLQTNQDSMESKGHRVFFVAHVEIGCFWVMRMMHFDGPESK